MQEAKNAQILISALRFTLFDPCCKDHCMSASRFEFPATSIKVQSFGSKSTRDGAPRCSESTAVGACNTSEVAAVQSSTGRITTKGHVSVGCNHDVTCVEGKIIHSGLVPTVQLREKACDRQRQGMV